MTFKDLCITCNNFTPHTVLKIRAQGSELYVGTMDNVYDDIADRLVQWFSIRDDVITIKLCEV